MVNHTQRTQTSHMGALNVCSLCYQEIKHAANLWRIVSVSHLSFWQCLTIDLTCSLNRLQNVIKASM